MAGLALRPSLPLKPTDAGHSYWRGIRGTYINARDRYGLTVLTTAVSEGQVAVVEYLLTTRADPTIKTDSCRAGHRWRRWHISTRSTRGCVGQQMANSTSIRAIILRARLRSGAWLKALRAGICAWRKSGRLCLAGLQGVCTVSVMQNDPATAFRICPVGPSVSISAVGTESGADHSRARGLVFGLIAVIA